MSWFSNTELTTEERDRIKKKRSLKTFIVNGIEVDAKSHEDAVKELYGTDRYKEVKSNDLYNLEVQEVSTVKYFWLV